MRTSGALAITLAVSCAAHGARAQFLISGNDEKRSWDAAGKLIDLPPGKDSVSIIDIRNRIEPKIVATLPLKNTIHGPPTNLAITPDNRMALVANSLDAVAAEGGGWKDVPDNEIFVIDLTQAPPTPIATVTAGKQPSGMAIDRGGNFALVADRADNAVSLLSVNGKARSAALVATVPIGIADADPTAVAITPDSKRALVTLSRANKVAVLTIDGSKLTDTGYTMTTGIYPYNVQITPDGKLGLVNNQGSNASDGQADTLSVIDLDQAPPRVIDQVMVGDGPEGLAVSPAGGYAASLLLNGTGSPKSAFYHHEHSIIALLRIAGKKVTKVDEARVEGSAEGIAFSPDGRFLYVGSFSQGEIAILRLQGEKLVQVGSLRLPGHPASLRGNTP